MKTRARNNIAAIRLLKELEISGSVPTEEQRGVLARYVGWGGIPQAFDPQNESFSKEYAELKSVLSDAEYSLSKGSVFNAYYTSKTVIDAVFAGLSRLGLQGGKLLEPALGTGRFLGLLPENLASEICGVELDKITGEIAKHLYPQAKIAVKGFEETEFQSGTFDAVATNVPFGSYKVFDPEYNKFGLYIHD